MDVEEILTSDKIPAIHCITRLVIDVRFPKHSLKKPYGQGGELDCGTVYEILNVLGDEGYDVELAACVTNAAKFVEVPDKNVLHPEMRKSYGEIDG